MNQAKNRLVRLKIVYDGPGLAGKTTNMEIVHERRPPDRRGEVTSKATEGDRTLFFHFVPREPAKVLGMDVGLELMTVAGAVYYNATRKLALQGADAVIFVADSLPEKLQENQDSLLNLEERGRRARASRGSARAKR